MFSYNVFAVEIAGVEVASTANVVGVGQTLKLNGAGVRSKFFIKVYVAALYLPALNADAATLIRNPPANRVLMHFVYGEVSKKKLNAGWSDGFEDNVTAEKFAELQPRLAQFSAMFDDMHEGDVVWLDYLPEEGTRVTINGTIKGTVAGADFNAALLSVWLGEDPVTSSLKKALLAADK